jgi:hypothetical protein
MKKEFTEVTDEDFQKIILNQHEFYVFTVKRSSKKND